MRWLSRQGYIKNHHHAPCDVIKGLEQVVCGCIFAWALHPETIDGKVVKNTRMAASCRHAAERGDCALLKSFSAFLMILFL